MKKIISILLMINLIGCQNIQFSSHRNTFAGSGAIFEKSQFVKQDICKVLNKFHLVNISGTGKNVYCKIKEGAKDDEKYMVNRNNMLFYVIAMSDQKCGVYKKSIVSKKGTFDFFSGSLATLFSGAGAIISHQTTAQLFSAAAGVVTGTKAEYDKAFYSDLALNVIVAGIDQARSDYQNKIDEKLTENLLKYPVTAALSDAMKYHSKCIATEGLNQAKEALAEQKSDDS